MVALELSPLVQSAKGVWDFWKSRK
jgi:hypothetical protein